MSGLGNRVQSYLLSLPERLLRSTSALAGGIVYEASGIVVPAAFRRTRLYKSMVEAVLRFLVEQVGQVEGVFPEEGKLAEDFLLRRTAGNGVELLGILTFRASPVWVLAVLADLSGGGSRLIREISESLKKEGLISPDASPTTLNQVLDALEQTAGAAAESFNTLPLDVATLRQDWARIQEAAQRLPAIQRPSLARVEQAWQDLRATARQQERPVFQVSSVLALDALTTLPGHFVWLGRTTRVAALRTTEILSEAVLDHYAHALDQIRRQGLLAWWKERFSPYLRAAARQFSPHRPTLTERVFRRRKTGGSSIAATPTDQPPAQS